MPRTSIRLALAAALLLSGPLPSVAAPDEVNRALADELTRRDVVMLGDFSHGQAYPYRCLMGALDAWVDAHGTSRELTLVMEYDRERTALVERLLDDGDPGPLLAWGVAAASLETFEFHEDLRALRARLDPPSRLRVLGVEATTRDDITRISRTESYRYFVEQRDADSAANVLAHLDAEPGRDVLAFYGALHLNAAPMDKPFAPEGYPPEKTRGVFLAHHLKAARGDDAVLTVVYTPLRELAPGAAEAPDWMDWDDRPADLPTMYEAGHDYDRIVFLDDLRISPHPIRLVCARAVFVATLDELVRLEPTAGTGLMSARYLDRLHRSLDLISGADLSVAPEGERRAAAAAYDGPARLESPAFGDAVIGLIGDLARGDESAAAVLMELGLPLRNIRPALRGGEMAHQMFWADHRDEVFALQAAGMMWFGDAEERAWAEARLADLAGRRFATPGEVLKWWRARYRDVSY